MTGEDYIRVMEEKATRKEDVEKEKEVRRQEVEPARVKRAKEKAQRQVEKIVTQSDWTTCRAFNH
jgi:hypothetical protein